MPVSEFFDIVRQALWTTAMIAAPILVVSLITGLTVGLLQALTSVQEMTITFVPKLGALLLTFWLTMDYMTETLIAFFQNDLIPMLGRF